MENHNENDLSNANDISSKKFFYFSDNEGIEGNDTSNRGILFLIFQKPKEKEDLKMNRKEDRLEAILEGNPIIPSMRLLTISKT